MTKRLLVLMLLALNIPAADSPIIGKWATGHISSRQYKNAYTGVAAPTNGSRFSYEFQPDGRYQFSGLMQMVMSNCTNTTFSNETGTYTINGDSVSLHPENNPYKMNSSCAPSSNREAPGKLINRTYRFRITSNAGPLQLELTNLDGSQTQTFQLTR